MEFLLEVERKRAESRPISEQIFSRCCKLLPGGVNSPVRAFGELLQPPLVVDHGVGDELVDVDGFRYIDYSGAWGSLIHGHAHPLIVEAASRQLLRGSSFGLTTASEMRLAAWMAEQLPWIEKLRCVSSGTEATMSAVRLARVATGRQGVLKFHGNYHGHAELFLSTQDPLLFSLPYDDLVALASLLEKRGKELACVILEPIASNMGVILPSQHFLKELREETRKQGILLIFDEVVTGFRVGLQGASGYFGLSADLTCFGKIMGGGFPAAALGGRADLMKLLAPTGPVYQAGTLSGNPVAMEAGYQALTLCSEPGFYERLKEKTDVITRPLKQWITSHNAPLVLHQVGSMFTLFFGKKEIRNLEDGKNCDKQQFIRFFHGLFERGIYFAPSPLEAHFVSAAHTEEHLLYTRDVLLEVLKEVCGSP